MQAEKRERHRKRRERLNLRQVRDAIGREAEQQPRDERGVVALRQLVTEQVRAKRAERERQKEHDVVGRSAVPLPSQWSGVAIRLRPSRFSEKLNTPGAG